MSLTNVRRWGLGAALAAILLWPAIYNGFPIVFPDTTAYLNVALSQSWTLDRSGFYGLFLKPAFLIDVVGGAWAAVAIQAGVTAAIILAATQRMVREPDWRTLVVVAAIAALTSLPWHAAQLMPDAFTGPLVLLGWLVASRDTDEPGSALLWLAVTVLTLFHYTHLLILPVVVATCLAARYFLGEHFRTARRNLVALGICLVSAVGAEICANGVMFDRWTVSPMGSYFLFARLQEDGLVPDWMARHCGADASPELCAIEPQIPRDSQLVLWGGSASPLDSRINAHLNTPDSWAWIDRLQQAALGSLREEPLRFGKSAIRAGASQFVHFQALDDECPQRCGFPGLTKSVPKLGEAIGRSRQVKDRLPRQAIQTISSILALLGLLLMPPLMIFAARKKDADALSLLACVAAALCANALITGGLSDVHDRYQSRLVWLAPLTVALVLVRWRQSLSRQAASQTKSATA